MNATTTLTRPSRRLSLPCQIDNRPFFAEQARDVEEAKALCASCPIRTACLTGALQRREPWGVWGGEVFIDGVVVAHKRGRGRPRKNAVVTPHYEERPTAA